MNDKPRKQLSLRFDNYAELHDEAKKYCEINNITLTELVATGLRLAMTSQQASQMPSHDKTANNDDRLAKLEERQAKLEEQLATTSQGSAIAPDRELIRDEIDNRTAYLATAMNEVKSELENEIQFLKTRVEILEQNQEEKPESSPVTQKTTEENVDLASLQEELGAIASETTKVNVASQQAGKKKKEKPPLEKVKNAIYMRLMREGIKFDAPIIKNKILEMYPNPEDWVIEDARKDVTEALKREHR